MDARRICRFMSIRSEQTELQSGLTMTRKTCQFSGRVQGVGFRYTAQNVAMQFNVRGYVRNLPDGSVELVAEGPEDQTSGLIDALQSRMQGFVTRLTTQDSPATGEFQGFEIRR